MELGSATPPELPAEVLALDVRCNRQAPGVVRAALGQIAGLDVVLADASLVASELVTNAVVHSGGSEADLLHVTAVLRRDGLLISVHDPGLTSRNAQVLATEDLQPHGRGLQIVEQLASRWGSERHGGYRVWADLPVPSRRSSRASP
jgi:anti-sigma regulatory factor (Ser/Thr protein kinase)